VEVVVGAVVVDVGVVVEVDVVGAVVDVVVSFAAAIVVVGPGVVAVVVPAVVAGPVDVDSAPAVVVATGGELAVVGAVSSKLAAGNGLVGALPPSGGLATCGLPGEAAAGATVGLAVLELEVAAAAQIGTRRAPSEATRNPIRTQRRMPGLTPGIVLVPPLRLSVTRSGGYRYLAVFPLAAQLGPAGSQ
jgi:hypothetical protein